MSIFYTVDGRGSLSSGLVMNLIKYDDIEPSELQEHADNLFPEGVSSFGERYFLRDNKLHENLNNQLELVFEYVRRSFYSDAPSRFQSLFGFDSIESARAFNREYRKDKSSIWKIKAGKSFRADMKLLHSGSILVVSYLAHIYWSGKTIEDNPFWEFLLSPPIKVIGIVE